MVSFAVLIENEKRFLFFVNTIRGFTRKRKTILTLVRRWTAYLPSKFEAKETHVKNII